MIILSTAKRATSALITFSIGTLAGYGPTRNRTEPIRLACVRERSGLYLVLPFVVPYDWDCVPYARDNTGAMVAELPCGAQAVSVAVVPYVSESDDLPPVHRTIPLHRVLLSDLKSPWPAVTKQGAGFKYLESALTQSERIEAGCL